MTGRAPPPSLEAHGIRGEIQVVSFGLAVLLVDVAKGQPVKELQFAHVDAGYTSDWHHAPRRQFVLVLSGEMEVTVADGETRSFGPGSVFLVEDTAGAGHQTRAAGAGECVFVTVAC